MTKSARWAVLATISALTYGVLVLPVALWPMRDLRWDLLFFSLYCLMALGLAIDVAELSLALVWRPRRVALLDDAKAPAAAAIVMTICDDWDRSCLAQLGALVLAGHHVYVLDDSDQPMLPSVANGVTVVRRPSRDGAKGGNLNHWLRRFGSHYEYLVVLDADSVVSPESVQVLLRAAGHPENQAVGVFQAKIGSLLNERSSLFERLQSTGARPRARVHERVHSQLDVLLSFGHNQLIRMAALRAVGGFDEQLTSEDTVLSLQLASIGYRTVLVDTWTHEREPVNISRYVARTTRWARQTVELFTRDWRDTPTGLKLLLCRHLLSYLLPVVGTALLAASVWTGPASPREVLSFLKASLTWTEGYRFYSLTLWLLTSVFGLVTLLRVVIARSEGVSGRELALGFLLGTGPHAALLAPLAIAIASSLVGSRVRFVPTNHFHQHLIRSRLGLWLGTALPVGIICTGVVRHPGSLLVGFNFLWIALLAMAPLTLAILDRVRQPVRDPRPVDQERAS